MSASSLVGFFSYTCVRGLCTLFRRVSPQLTVPLLQAECPNVPGGEEEVARGGRQGVNPRQPRSKVGSSGCSLAV